jgi:hypothetical protein
MLERSAAKVCAVVRTDRIATRGGRRSRQVTPRRTTDLDPKGRGDKSMLVKREVSEGVYDMVLQRLRDTAKGEFPESQCPGVEPHPRRYHACYRRHREPSVRLSPVGRLARWTMRNECIQGHEWGAYVVLGRSAVTEHGMAYSPRGLGSRSANSSRGRDVPPGSAGKPRAGRSGAGGRMSGTGEVRAMRNAKAGPPIDRHWSGKATGERLKIERLTSRSEGSGWKSTSLGNSLAAYPTARCVLRGERSREAPDLPGGGLE